MKSTGTRVLTVFVGMLLFAQMALAQIAVFPPTTRVADLAQVLNVVEVEALTRQLEQFEQQTGVRALAVTVTTLSGESIEAFSRRTFASSQLGDQGLLLALSLRERTVRIHTGTALRARLPDAQAHRVVEDRMTPAFREQAYARGFSNAVEALSASLRPQDSQPDAAVSPAPNLLLGVGLAASGAFAVSVLIVIALRQRKARREAEVRRCAEIRERYLREAREFGEARTRLAKQAAASLPRSTTSPASATPGSSSRPRSSQPASEPSSTRFSADSARRRDDDGYVVSDTAFDVGRALASASSGSSSVSSSCFSGDMSSGSGDCGGGASGDF